MDQTVNRSERKPWQECGRCRYRRTEDVTMGERVYNIVKAPIGWSLFRDRQRLGGHVSAEAALQAATQAGAVDVRDGPSIRINVLRPAELNEIAAGTSCPTPWPPSPKHTAPPL